MDTKVKIEVREMDLLRAMISLLKDVTDDARINEHVRAEYNLKINEIIAKDWSSSGEIISPHFEKA